MTKAEFERIANQVMEDSEFAKANTNMRHWRTAIRSMLVDAMRLAVAPLEAENAELRKQLAEQWQPVSDGLVYEESIDERIVYRLYQEEDMLKAYYENIDGFPSRRNRVEVELNQTVRLCRPTQPAPVQP